MSRTLLWDFDETLAHRPGMWAGCLVEALDEDEPGHGVCVDDLRPFLRDGFPWHEPLTPHPELNEPEAWWASVGGLLARAYTGAGIEQAPAARLATLVRRRYVDPAVGWTLFPDTAPVLWELRAAGWGHVILSNHVPELPELVRGLGLDELVDTVITSASIGYEKPHPQAFACARRVAGDIALMVGDNYEADVAGAEAVGIPAVLVRRKDVRAQRAASDLTGVASFLA
jgi:putative hydrolase of the HAD superfamily